MGLSSTLPRMMNYERSADDLPNITTSEVEIHIEDAANADDISISSTDAQLPNTEAQLGHNLENNSKPENSTVQIN